MKKHMIIAATVLAAGVGAAGVTSAAAASETGMNDHAEMQALTSAKLSASDAIRAVQQAHPGKVAEVKFGVEKGAAAYEVSILAANGTEHGFIFDANTGKISKVSAGEDHKGEAENGGENGDSED